MGYLYEFRIRRHRRSFPQEGNRAGEPGAAFSFLRELAKGLDRETFYTLHLDVNAKIIGFEVVAVGGLSSVEVHPREVFRAAILAGSAAIIVAHNHPSGNVKHSSDDIALFERLVESGKILGIDVVDSIVVTEYGYESMANEIGMEQARHARTRRMGRPGGEP